MHPIEQLRYVARATGADARLLVEEAASALRVFGRDSAGLLTASRRLLTRQPGVGPLWWLCSYLILSNDPQAEAREMAGRLRDDPTGRRLTATLPEGARVGFAGWPDTIVEALARRGDCSALIVDVDGMGPSVVRRLDRVDVEAEDVDGARIGGLVSDVDIVLIEVAAAGPAAGLVDVGNIGLAATAKALGRPVWLVVPMGCYLPEAYWQAIVERAVDGDRPPWLAATEVIGFGLVDQVLRGDELFEVDRLASTPPDCPVATELLVEAR